MRLRDLLWFLLGDGKAITRCATDPRALWIGLFYVLLAAIARDYDHEYFLFEPWHLLIPAGASLGTDFVLFSVLWWVAGIRQPGRYWPCFRQFLALFWLTAPLAWIYAIPFERVASQVDAVQGNLWLLLLVASWRVLLTMKIVAVLYRVSVARVFGPVMWVADSVAIVAMVVVPFPIIAIMGGVAAPHEQLVANVSIGTLVVGFYSWPVWMIWAFCSWLAGRGMPRSAPPSLQATSYRAAPWVFGSVVLVVGTPFLWGAQLEQRQRWLVEDAVARKAWDEAVDHLCVADASYPPFWRPPKASVWMRDRSAPLVEVLLRLQEAVVPQFVRQAYERRYAAELDASVRYGSPEQRSITPHLHLLLSYPDAARQAPQFVDWLREHQEELRAHTDASLLFEVLRRY